MLLHRIEAEDPTMLVEYFVDGLPLTDPSEELWYDIFVFPLWVPDCLTDALVFPVCEGEIIPLFCPYPGVLFVPV